MLQVFAEPGKVFTKLAFFINRKNQSLKPGISFTPKPDYGSYIFSIAKTTFNKMEVCIRSMKFLSPDFALYLHKHAIQTTTGYCCNILHNDPNLCLRMTSHSRGLHLDVPSISASLEILTHCRHCSLVYQMLS